MDNMNIYPNLSLIFFHTGEDIALTTVALGLFYKKVSNIFEY